MGLVGNRIVIRPAEESDRRNTYTWLAESDIDASMMGSPCYVDHPVPSWKEYRWEYPPQHPLFPVVSSKRTQF